MAVELIEWQWAEALLQAESTRVPIPPLTESNPELTIEQAYAIQQLVVAYKTRRGRTIVGHKVGLTSDAMQKMLGVNQPDFGHLLDHMRYRAGATIDFPLIQPRVEPEIAFVLKRDLLGPGVTWDAVMAATDYVVPALEVIDSRIRDWRIRLIDTVADNASSGCFVLGQELGGTRDLDLALQGLTFTLNGTVVQTGAGAAVLGHPAHAVAWLANTLGELGTPLRAGQIILSGSISAAVPIKAKTHVSARIGRLGMVDAYFPV